MILDDSEESEGSNELLLDFPPKPRILTEARRQASRQLAIRRAVTVASASTQSKINNANMPPSYVQYAREKLELDGCLLTSELAFLDRMRDMDHEDRIDTLFELFDLDGNGLIEISELKTLFQERMKETNAGKEAVPAVEMIIGRYDEDETFDRNTFVGFAKQMQKAFNCKTFLNLCFLMAQTVAFNEGTRKILEESTKENMQKAKEEDGTLGQMDEVFAEARLILIFAMLDSEGNGIVSFPEVVKHLFHYSEDMDFVKKQVLLMYDSKDLRTLDQNEFAEVLLNVLVMCNGDIHDLADAVTLSVARDDVSEKDMLELMMDPDKLIQNAANLNNFATRAHTADLTYGRLERLFDMLDIDHDGHINTSELCCFLEKYNPDQKKAVTLFSLYDINKDGRLDFEEFANMIITFAGKDVGPHKLIDYLCVQIALGDNTPKEAAYMTSLRQIGQRLKDSLTNNPAKRMSLPGFIDRRGSNDSARAIGNSQRERRGSNTRFKRNSQGASRLISKQQSR